MAAYLSELLAGAPGDADVDAAAVVDALRGRGVVDDVLAAMGWVWLLPGCFFERLGSTLLLPAQGDSHCG